MQWPGLAGNEAIPISSCRSSEVKKYKDKKNVFQTRNQQRFIEGIEAEAQQARLLDEAF